MADITITIPDTHATWAIDALCDFGGYDENQLEGETRKGITLGYIRRVKQAEKDGEILTIQEGLDIT
jgi:hypothetical protein